MNTNNTIILEWEAQIRPDHERSDRWYMVGGAFCAVMVAYGIFSGAWSTSLVFAFIPALYYLVRNQAHARHTIRITELGVEFDARLSVWGELHEFWILAGPGYHELHISLAKKSRAEIVIQTGGQDPYQIRDVLSQYLPQVADRRERILDAIIRFCKI